MVSGAQIGRCLSEHPGAAETCGLSGGERPGPVLSVGGKWPRVVQSLPFTASGPRDDESKDTGHPGVSFLGDKDIKM